MTPQSSAAFASHAGLGAFLVCAVMVQAAEKAEHFDRDPNWDGHNNRITDQRPREVRQNFGYTVSSHCGSGRGEIGGFICPAAEAAWYGKPISIKTFDDRLTASGKLNCEGRQFHVLLGFFNTNTVNEWRTPNAISLRLYGRGDVFYAYVEYATSKWRAGGNGWEGPGNAQGKRPMKPFAGGKAVHNWTLTYDPRANGGGGALSGTLGDDKFEYNLDPGHKSDGATFNCFGLLTVLKQHDSAGELWLDDIEINGERFSFDSDPHWLGFGNRTNFFTRNCRPWFDFGYSNTHLAGGERSGEIGGLIYRGDGRWPHTMAFYGDRLEALTLERSLRASGKVSLCRGLSDSDTLFGFFHSEHSLDSGGSDRIGQPPDFLGVAIGGPSREGFFFAPSFRVHGGEAKTAARGPYIYPDSTQHNWSLAYEPGASDANGSIVVKLDNNSAHLEIPASIQRIGAHFNRFGFITTHTDGNCQRVYLDDLTYTTSQK